MTKVYSEGLAPDTEVADLEHSEVPWQGQDDGLPVVPPQRDLLAILVRDSDTLGTRLAASAHPELGV